MRQNISSQLVQKHFTNIYAGYLPTKLKRYELKTRHANPIQLLGMIKADPPSEKKNQNLNPIVQSIMKMNSKAIDRRLI